MVLVLVKRGLKNEHNLDVNPIGYLSCALAWPSNLLKHCIIKHQFDKKKNEMKRIYESEIEKFVN